MPQNVNFPEPIEYASYSYNCRQNKNGYCRKGKVVCCYNCSDYENCGNKCKMKNDGIDPSNCGSSILIKF